MNDLVMSILDMVQSVDPPLRIVVAGLAILLETSVLVGLVVPGDTIVIVAGTAVSSWPEGVVLGAAIVAASVAGESIGFVLGRLLGPRVRASRLGDRIGQAGWARAERYLERRGGTAIFLSRFLPVLHSLVPLTVGMSGFTYLRFIAWTLPACVIWAGTYVTAAAVAAATFRELSDTVHYAGYVFVAMIVGFLLLVTTAKKLVARSEQRRGGAARR
ncbi:DedA family protein [Phycicoccus sp. CSK15P-2]|uniref:DedA family protein n=1 Tax=Phycicoccus sp. CSK15P-2 TaxID=2807627 RepID=UPI00194DE157|nr:DedA family protein [Phycicoccus sp. CSK15P-2]MBM6402972.1 DedA family protein [Phycicoccus sp. CSK15P-2]